MIERLVKWLLRRTKAETQQKEYVKQMYVLAELLYDTYDFIDNSEALQQQLYIIAFNTKYAHLKDELTGTPHDNMMRYKKLAMEKSFDFFKEPFYVEMKRQKDKEIVKMRVIINRLNK